MKPGRHSLSQKHSKAFRILACGALALLSSSCGVPAGLVRTPSAARRPPRTYHPGGRADALIYVGAGSWGTEASAIKELLAAHRSSSLEVDSSDLNSMSLDEMKNYKLLIFPGGDARTITQSMTEATHAKIRDAVQTEGVNYIGFCAGAWIAVAPAPEPGKDVLYGLGVVFGPIQEETSMKKQGLEYAVSRASFPDGSKRDLLWYGGPVTPEIPGGVIAKYPDGKPAITQIWSGKALVIVSGLHPAVPDTVVRELGLVNHDGPTQDFGWKLLDAALQQNPLPAF